ncbi:MAG: hypothetical protein ACMXYG_04035 [Candidatus Woesearchaeota archaeon]
MNIDSVKELLRKYTGKKYVYFTNRGNTAIKSAFNYAKSKGYNSVHIQDQGGWMTYQQFAKKASLEVFEIKTDYGLVYGEFSDAVLLINTMPAYAFLQDVSKIKTKNCLVINDVSGCLGLNTSKWGDIIFGSFGKWKPVNLEKGGFIASNFEMDIDEYSFTNEELEILYLKLSKLPERYLHFQNISKKIKQDLKKFEIIHPDLQGINVLIKCDGVDMEEIKVHCQLHGYEVTECPRYIRMNEKGLSIEVKRL